MKKRILSFLLAIISLPALSQQKLNDYIAYGLTNNQILKEKNISLEQSLLALKNAKSFFLPTAGFITDYSSAKGGRTITFPAGDLLNQVYSTLNQLSSSQRFPQVNNVTEQFLPHNFYDARLHITYPLLNTDLYYQKQISKQLVVMQEYEVDIYRQELVKEIKIAYFNYCSLLDALEIYRNALELVKQNLKVNQSLLKNGNGLPANVLRAESELQDIAAKIIDAQNQRANARNYVNFLINKPLTDSVEFEKQALPDSAGSMIAGVPSTAERGELKQLNAAIVSSDNVVKLNKSFYVPKLNTFLDLGSQASDFKFNSNSRYYFVGAELNIPIFSGGRNRNNIKIAELDRSSFDSKKDLLALQLQISAETSRNNVLSALAAYEANKKQLASAKAYFNLVDKGFRAGTNSLIEFIDARNQLTASSLKLSINQYNVLIQLAEFERQTNKSKNK